ncbi:hypothetical protein OVS_03335 [Mycoplasma ovis str. Michigan]|uniref:Uncharacterized protein n=1 Tax=Mycoplasma ovis str. Michigan TaxID=1415773 RepID=A0ABM5P1W0_9MOLU|nr:hypothetical protein OVS_03300 [Mycoplasma ovis str. Michigan]AHC40419.1 hypothetical protein OVS_03335 [Mycoplasma ovis str. Michigan]
MRFLVSIFGLVAGGGELPHLFFYLQELDLEYLKSERDE